MAWHGLAWPGLAWFGLAWHGLVWPGPDPACLCLAWRGPGLAWPGLAVAANRGQRFFLNTIFLKILYFLICLESFWSVVLPHFLLT